MNCIIGREAETATLLKRSLVNSELRGFGFALRQLRRSAFRGGINGLLFEIRTIRVVALLSVFILTC